MDIVTVQNLKKYFGTGPLQVKAVDGIDLSIEKGKLTAVIGASGSGKTTLLNLIGGLYQPTEGTVTVDGVDLGTLREEELTVFRRRRVGFVFQDFNLLDTMSLRDNIYLPLVLAGVPYRQMEERIVPLARKLEIGELLDKYPYEVSGGQKQRAAVCRALITKPDIVLADEPTGALDSRASGKLLQLFREINEEGQTILMVTHSIQAAAHAGRVLFIKDGCVFHQIYRGGHDRDEMYRMISEALTVMQTQQNQGFTADEEMSVEGQA